MKKTNLIPSSKVKTLLLTKSEVALPSASRDVFGVAPLIEMEQIHSANWLEIIQPQPASTKIPKVDGLITYLPGHVLVVRTADCLPILLAHSSGLVGALHAGRQGTQAQFLLQLLTYLRDQKQISSGLQIWFGPAICERCYQIDRSSDQHYSLVDENLAQLHQVFRPDQIKLTIDHDCTQHQANYYSYRREGVDAGRNYSLISRVT